MSGGTTGGKVPPSARQISWQRTGSGEEPYEAEVDGRRWAVRINDFPAAALYTLLIDGEAVEDLEGWPPGWKRPEGSGPRGQRVGSS